MEHNNEINIKCPYCNWENRNSWEFEFDGDEDTQITCGSCEKEFNVTKNITVTYSSSRIACEESKHNYKLERHFESKHDYINRERIAKPESKWKWYRIEVCEICDDKQYVEITEQQYEKEMQDVISKSKAISY